MTRIVYKDNGSGVLVSCNNFPHPTNGALFVVELLPAEKMFRVVDRRAEDTIVVSGTGTSMHKVKIAAKKALADLGIEFASELRKKKPSPVTTG